MSSDKKLMWYEAEVEVEGFDVRGGQGQTGFDTLAWSGECASAQEATIKAAEYGIRSFLTSDDPETITVTVYRPTEHPDWPLLSELRDWYWGIGMRANFDAMNKTASFIGHECRQIDEAARLPFVEMTQIVLDRKNLGMMEFSERAFVDWMGTFAHTHENAHVLLDELRAKLVSHMFSLIKDGMRDLQPPVEGVE